METLKIRCPRCKNEFRVDESSSGQVMGCPNCQQKIRIPKIEKKTSICFDIAINRISDDHRIEVIAAIRELKGIGQMEAVDFAEHLPQTLLKNIPSERAEQLKRRLEEAGAVVHMEPSDTQGVREENDSARKTDDEKTAKEIPELDKKRIAKDEANGVVFDADKRTLLKYPEYRRFMEYKVPVGVTAIGAGAFRDCGKLRHIVISEGVAAIGSNAFRGCANLTSIVIPNSVTSIGARAFRDCGNLTKVVIPNSVRTIGDGAFIGCKSLTNVIIPNSVTSVGDEAFWNCESLTKAVIPNSVRTIGCNAFPESVSQGSEGLGCILTVVFIIIVVVFIRSC